MGKIEENLRSITKDILLRKKIEWEGMLKDIYPNARVHYSVDFAYKDIKSTLDKMGFYTGYIKTKTDCGADKRRDSDGGIIYITAQIGGEYIYIPIAWIEIKSSSSCTKTESRGQATGLITEQAETCRIWANAFGGYIKPLIAFLEGDDFDSSIGFYNIDRIRINLQTEGNKDPYKEKNNNLCVSWFFFSPKFSDSDFANKIELAIDKNVRAAKTILEKIVLDNDCNVLEEEMCEPCESYA